MIHRKTRKEFSSLKYFPFSDKGKYNTLEESFRGHYKRRSAQLTKTALPYVVGNDTNVTSPKLFRPHREDVSMSTSNIRQQRADGKDLRKVSRREPSVNSSIHEKLLLSLKKKNVLTRKKHTHNDNKYVSRERYTSLEPSGESSSSTTDASEDDNESIDDNVATEDNYHSEHGDTKTKVNSPFSSEHDNTLSAMNQFNLSLPKINKNQEIAKKRSHSNRHNLAISDRIYAGNLSGASKKNMSDNDRTILANKQIKFATGKSASTTSIDIDDSVNYNNDESKMVCSKLTSKQTLSPQKSGSILLDDINGVSSTKALLKEYKMVIKWREKQQIALQQRLEAMYEKHNNYIQLTLEEKRKCTQELEDLKKKINAQTQKNSVLAKSHCKKEQSIEKLVEVLEKERNSFAKEKETLLSDLRKAEKIATKYKNEASVMKTKYDQKLLQVVDAAAESHFCPWETFHEAPLLPPSSFPNKCDKQGDHKYNSTTHKFGNSLEEAGQSLNTVSAFVQSIDEVSKSEAEERRSKSSNNDVRQLLMEVEVLKCELDSNQEELSRCRRANTVLKRNCYSSDHISESEKCFQTSSSACQVNMTSENSLKEMGKQIALISDAHEKSIEDLEIKLCQKVRSAVLKSLSSGCICSNCNEIYNDPFVIIPCGHTFCASCLNGATKCNICSVDIEKTTPNLVLSSLCGSIMVDMCSKRIMEQKELIIK